MYEFIGLTALVAGSMIIGYIIITFIGNIFKKKQ